ncbi:MAG: hypothetical protein Q8R81_09555 [Novosphingobium sp.]|uniref:phage regulatory CII family protein n=1 Tax=Novosphingobium sp. TaxID=1874826 RepID=UPI002735326B|nr:phage regulatory CII family protein [Novosphingobium sp.]MDP3550630.1 hypothetical protein [Novosphingobium sp.]
MGGKGRIKRAVRHAVHLCGGVDGAAATAERGRSVAGDWNNLNHAAFPPADCALALDEIAVAAGQLPPITSALARELGGVFVPNIDVLADEGSIAGMVMGLSKELGDVAGSISAALADGKVSPLEADAALGELHDMTRKAAQLCAALESIRGDS